MLSIADAYARVFERFTALPSERVSLDDSLCRFVATPLVARADDPRFDNSAMDGWAVRCADLTDTAELAIVGESRAGAPCARTLLRGAKAGTDDWYVAKLNQLICLRRINVDTAKKVWRQFLILDPQMGGDKWRERFEDAGKGL